jgi:hypothetical protein
MKISQVIKLPGLNGITRMPQQANGGKEIAVIPETDLAARRHPHSFWAKGGLK